jgi:O-antigen biosynthesis protein
MMTIRLTDPAPTPGRTTSATVEVRPGDASPPVTLVIPTRNRVSYLQEAIASCLGQSYPHCRIVVADDGSIDGTVALVRSLASHGVSLVTGPHVGGPSNRNRTLATLETPFVMWVGDDDVLLPNAVASRIAMLQRFPDADIVHGDLLQVNAALEPQQPITYEDWYHRPDALLATLFQRNVIADGGSLVRTAVYARAGLYDDAYPRGHDYHLWSRLATRARFKHDPGVTYLWRWHGSNLGLGGGVSPYADCHRRIVYEMWARYDRERLLPEIPWNQIPAAQRDGIAALALADRLAREHAWDDAQRFARLAVTLGAGAQAEGFVQTLAERGRRAA